MARSPSWQRQLDLESLRLAPGSHRSPREGVCVVELASLIGGESFSDRPRCVCPVIAAFLRSFNEKLAMRLRIFVVVGLREALRLDEGAGEYAARVAFARHGAEEAFALL